MSRKELRLPPLRKTITVVTERNGKYEPFTINFEYLIREYSDLINLLQEFQVGIELWAEHKSIYSICEMPFDHFVRSFFDFVRVIKSKKKIKHLSEITANVMRNYKLFLDASNGKFPKERCYLFVKLYIQEAQQSKFNKLSIIGSWQGTFPSNFARGSKPKDGLPDKVLDKLIIVIKDIFNICKNNIKERKRILKNPIYMSDFDAWTLDNTLWYYHNKYLNGVMKKSTLREILEMHGYSVEEVKSIYDDVWPDVSDKAMDPTKIRAMSSQSNSVKISIAVSELAYNYPEYPFDMNVLEAAHFLTEPGYALTTKKYPTIGMYVGHSSEQLYRCAKSIKSPFSGVGFGGVHAVNSFFHPNMKVLGACFLLIQLESGWNQQTLLDFEFGESFEGSFYKDICCENHRVMVSQKYRASEEAFHRTYVKNKYGAYQVLRFLWGFGRVMREKGNSKSPWLFISSYLLKTNGPTSQLSSYNIGNATRSICSGGDIKADDGTILRNFGSDRLRKNYADDLDEYTGSDPEKIASGLQDNISTTEKHYRNKPRQKNRLAKEQLEWTEHFAFFQGAFQPAGAIDISVIDTSTPSVVQIITTDGVEPVLICGNPFKPDWVNWQHSLEPGRRCGFFNGCATCSQANVFAETLPYIFVRIRNIERSQTKLIRPEWEKAYYYEYSAWKEIIEEWPNSEEVETARIQSNELVLPIRPVFNY